MLTCNLIVHQHHSIMKKFIVERILPGAGMLSKEEVFEIAKSSVDAIAKLGESYQWITSYVTDDKIYCVHIAETEAAVRKHARLSDIPLNVVSEVKMIIDPQSTAQDL